MAKKPRYYCILKCKGKRKKVLQSPYITSAERIGIKKGLEKGLVQGLEQGEK
jgi:hypothetical protein